MSNDVITVGTRQPRGVLSLPDTVVSLLMVKWFLLLKESLPVHLVVKAAMEMGPMSRNQRDRRTFLA